MLNQCNLVELFSGIGSQAKALKNLGVKVNTLGSSEWDVHAIAAYDVIHNSPEIPTDIQKMTKQELLDLLKKYTFSNSGKAPLEFKFLRTYSTDVLKRIYTSVRRNKNFVDITKLEGTMLPGNVDILTYSFPCQDLSNVGAFHGYNKGIDKDSGSRSSLLWQVGRILTEMKDAQRGLPRFLLLENVPTLLSQRHFDNFKTWIADLEDLGYVSQYYQLNASAFGLPQNRPRLLMISVFVGNNEEEKQLVLDYFKEKNEADIIQDYKESKYYHRYTVEELLRTNYENKKIFEEAVGCTPNDTVSRRKIWDENPQIVLPGNVLNPEIQVVRTITTKQDRNPNSGNLYFESKIEGRSKFRYLTPRECMLFMGFTDEDFRRLKNNNVEFHKGDSLFARDKIIRMAGNSIPVKMLEGIFLQVLQIDDMLEEYRKNSFEKGEFVNKIRKYLFACKIRGRKPGGHYPETPDAVFPAYKSALFLCDCLQHSHGCESSYIPLKNHIFWSKRIASIAEIDATKYSELEKEGWNVLVVWKCELSDSSIDDTLKRLEMKIRKNGAKERLPTEIIV